MSLWRNVSACGQRFEAGFMAGGEGNWAHEALGRARVRNEGFEIVSVTLAGVREHYGASRGGGYGVKSRVLATDAMRKAAHLKLKRDASCSSRKCRKPPGRTM